jgi:very-short-patch-repair endonuclease
MKVIMPVSKGYKQSPEYIANAAATRRIYSSDLEWKEKFSNKMRDIASAPEWRQRVSEGTKAGQTDEVKARMSQLRIGKKHSEETKSKIGRPRTPEAKLKIGAAAKLHIADIRRRTAARTGPTDIERILHDLLTSAYGADGFETEKAFGSYCADAYTPEDNIVWEADGSYWHRDADKDQRRDAFIIDSGVSAVIRFSDKELKQLSCNLKG